MSYALSKILWFFFQPSSIIASLIAGGLALQWSRFRGAGLKMATAGAVLMLVLGFSPIGGALLIPLEERFPRPVLDDGDAITGIIILGGAEDAHVGALRNVMSLNEAGERITEGVVLSRRFPNAKIVFSGGSASLLTTKPAEADVARGYLQALGVDPARILIDDKSRNTYENAVFTMELVKPKPGETWLLVTSAFHMPRAVGNFRKAGFDVRAFPVDYRTVGLAELYQPFDKIPEGLRRVDFAFKEYVGLVTAYLLGRSSALFPGP